MTLHVFLDRSIIEVFVRGAAVTERCALPPGLWRKTRGGGAPLRPTIDAFAIGGVAMLTRLESWGMRSMWGAMG